MVNQPTPKRTTKHSTIVRKSLGRSDFSSDRMYNMYKVHTVYLHLWRQIEDGCEGAGCCTRESSKDFKIACMLDNTGGKYVVGICEPKIVKRALFILKTIKGWCGRRMTAPYMDADGNPCKEDYYGFTRAQ